MSTNTPTAALSEAGVSIWLDDLSRKRITTGELERLIAERDVVGVTTNPTIFANAFADGESYTAALHDLAAQGTDVEHAIFEITTHDVRDAADHLREVYDRTDGYDGRVSIEVQPGLAHDTEGTVAEVHRDKVTRTTKGESVTRNGSDDDPAYVIEQEDGTTVLKLRSELRES